MGRVMILEIELMFLELIKLIRNSIQLSNLLISLF